MSGTELDESRLDDVAALGHADPSQMLEAIASSAAQVRAGARAAEEAQLLRLAEEGRPRAVVVTGMGGSAMAGDVFAALAGAGSPVPVVVHRGYGLPTWVGAADLVVAVSCSGTTEETLSAAEEAARRAARLVGVGTGGSPLADLVEQGRGTFVAAPTGTRMPRANLWALATPLVVLGDAMGLFSAPPAAVEATARQLESVSIACRPASESFVNPGKGLALDLAGCLPMAWGTTAGTAVVAYRLACQLAENAKAPAMHGVLPEANHNQVVALDGAWTRAEPDDFFRDRLDEPTAIRLRLVLLREAGEHPQITRRADASRALAQERGVPVTELTAVGESSYERLASLVGLVDYASVYLAILSGIDPSPIAPITELKQRISE